MDQTYELLAKIEALLVAADRRVTVSELARCLVLSNEEVEAVLRTYEEGLLAQDRGYQLQRKAGKVRIEVKTPYAALVGELFPERKSKPTSSQAREVLAAIARKQPISTQGVTNIREINSSSVISTLAQQGFIRSLKTRGEHHERKWKVTQRFLDAFDLDRAEDLYKDEVFARVFPEFAEPTDEIPNE